MTIKTIALCCLTGIASLLNPSGLMAQDEEYTPLAQPLDFIAVKDIRLMTSAVYEYGQIRDTISDDLHPGVETLSLTLYNYKEIQRDAAIPDSTSFSLTISDKAGNLVVADDMPLNNVFKKFKYSKNYSTMLGIGLTVLRGGEYTVSATISPDLFSYERDMILTDKPCMQITSPSFCNVDSIPMTELFFSSGYPYEPTEFAGEKTLHWSVASVSAPDVVISEGTESFELKSDIPTLSAIATLMFDPEVSEPGEYKITITSDFAPANHSYTLKVFDIVDPEISLDKSVYTVDESKEALLRVNFDYGYPYVGVDSEGGKPTIEVVADLLGDETTAEYTDDAWADSEVHCDAELHVPLDKITDSIVESYDGEIPLDLTIKFNGMDKFNATVHIPFHGTSGVKAIEDNRHERHKVKRYNILGVEVDENYRGIVITSDGKKKI